MEILEKGATLNLDIASKSDKQQKVFYFGAGWDNPNGPVDLDIVCVAADSSGKLTQDKNLVYFGNRSIPGIDLSEDNTTGDGDGDDESIVINTEKLDASVEKIYIGLAAYAGADLSNAPNPHFRACDGSTEDAEQIAEVKAGSGASGDTVLHAFTLTKGGEGWSMQNVASFTNAGTGKDAIKGFAELFG